VSRPVGAGALRTFYPERCLRLACGRPLGFLHLFDDEDEDEEEDEDEDEDEER
jgi:hypothetical protein